MTARIERFLPERASVDLDRRIRSLAEIEDVVHIAVMPDAHVAEDVCVGTVTATRTRIVPGAVGGDIGCGMVARRFDADAAAIERDVAARILAALYERVPAMRHPTAGAALPAELAEAPLSSSALDAIARREGRVELGTLGRGNHFLELQRDEDGFLWLMLHSGSRALGPAIRKHHEARAREERGLRFLDSGSDEGRAYLADAAWAATYARLNRERMEARVAEILFDELGAEGDVRIECDHNHVRLEEHGGVLLFVHRKGAARAGPAEMGIVPGSMGTSSFHVEGRGFEAALCSCSHGAGRAMSRSEARRRISRKRFEKEVDGIWFDHRIAGRLREEAPSAYKDIGRVMSAQLEMVRIVRRLEPILVYKGV
jgi:tRNA-splicing ligase RtcB